MREWIILGHSAPPKTGRPFLARYLGERGQLPLLASVSPLCLSLSLLCLSPPPPHPSLLHAQQKLIFGESPSLFMFLFFLDVMSEPLNSPSKGLRLCPFIAPLPSCFPWPGTEGRAKHLNRRKPS